MFSKPSDSSGVTNDNSQNSASIYALNDEDEFIATLINYLEQGGLRPQELDLALIQQHPYIIENRSIPLAQAVGSMANPTTSPTTTTSTISTSTSSPNVNLTAQTPNPDGDRSSISSNRPTQVKTHVVRSDNNDLLGANAYIVRGKSSNLKLLEDNIQKDVQLQRCIECKNLRLELTSSKLIILVVSNPDLFTKLGQYLDAIKDLGGYTISRGIVNKLVDIRSKVSSFFQPPNTNAITQQSQQKQRFQPYTKRPRS